MSCYNEQNLWELCESNANLGLQTSRVYNSRAVSTLDIWITIKLCTSRL